MILPDSRNCNFLQESGKLHSVHIPHTLPDGELIDWLVTHGGVGHSTVRQMCGSGLLHVSEAECVYGLGDREHTYQGRSNYNVADMPLAGYQLHGHRNGLPDEPSVPPIVYDESGDPVVCLDSGASTGGVLTVAVLNRLGEVNLRTYDDHVDPAVTVSTHQRPRPRRPHTEAEKVDDLLAAMRHCDQVRVRPVEGLTGIVSCNFTRDAFQHGVWNDLTMHARGLFIDEAHHRVAARGYEKFFHLGETPGRSREEWLNPAITAYPVILRKKWNGYLALVATINGELRVFSKSGVTPYSRFAEKLLAAQIDSPGRDQLQEMLERTNTTAVFEAIAARDAHPIAESGPDRLVLLDCIRNTVKFSTGDSIRDSIAARFGLECAATVGTAENPAEMESLLDTAQYRNDEGVVIIDQNGCRSKVKAMEYAMRKRARTSLQRVWSGLANTLPSYLATLEDQLRLAGIWTHLTINDPMYTLIGVDDRPGLDLAAVFDDLDTWLS